MIIEWKKYLDLILMCSKMKRESFGWKQRFLLIYQKEIPRMLERLRQEFQWYERCFRRSQRGYAFTDYKSQGQTIEYVIIDIGKPPTGSLSPFSVYVALSRSRGRDTIRLLRDFDPNLFQNHPSEALREDMKRLVKLNEETKKEWQTRQREKE